MTVTDERIDVLGVGVDVTSIPHVLSTVDGWITRGEQHYVCVTSVHGIMEAQQDPELLRIQNASGLTVPDGAPVLWAGRYAGAREMSRVRGPDLLPAVAERAAERGWRVYLYGGAEGTPELLAERLRERFPDLVVAGTYSPPFRPLTEDEQADVVARINGSGADIVMVGLSTPKQERWMDWARGKIRAAAMFGFGAAFDIHAGLATQAPDWIRPTGMEWLYRLLKDPRRLGPRYLKNNPRFLAAILRRPPRPARPAGVPTASRTKRAAYQAFERLERTRVHVLPAHYYSPVADRTWLRHNESLWRRPATLPGVDWDLDDQLRWLRKACADHVDEVRGFPFLSRLDELGIRFRYGLIEGQVLHCVVRSLAPRRIVEIGGGASTALMSDAVERNVREGRQASEIVAIDPFMPPEVSGLPRVEVRRIPAQDVSAALFADLGEGDLLFIDSSHAVKTGSELHRIYLELLPALPPGVLVHIHDIYLPYLYSPWVLGDFWDWQETALLAALLVHNPRLQVLCCQSALHHAKPAELGEVLPDYRPRPMADGLDDGGSEGHFPSSLWLRSR